MTTKQRSIEIVVGLARGLTRVPPRTRATGSREVLPEQAPQDTLAGLGPQDITGAGGPLTQLAARVTRRRSGLS